MVLRPGVVVSGRRQVGGLSTIALMAKESGASHLRGK